MKHLKHVIRLIRPLQWIKNLLVFFGVLFLGSQATESLWIAALFSAFSFCLVSSSVYVLNDIFDSKRDRAHPKKQFRPIASGQVSISEGSVIGAVLGILGLILGHYVSVTVFGILLCYLLLNIAYSIKLKHVVILDVFCISAGFMLRLLAGTIGVGIPPSKWLLMCGMMVTLFLGFAKRRAEIVSKKSLQQNQREVLADYNSGFLDQLMTICMGTTILSYSLYTMSPDTITVHKTENLIFTVPLVIYGLFRYLYHNQVQNGGEDPTTSLIKDRHIVATFLAWVLSIIMILKR